MIETWIVGGSFLFLVRGYLLFSCRICAAVVAESKNRDAGGWFLLGLFFGLVALIAVAGMPVKAPLGIEPTRRRDLTAPLICIALILGVVLWLLMISA